MALFNDPVKQTLWDNLAGNLVAAATGQQLVAPSQAIQQYKRNKLAETLAMRQEDRAALKAKMAKDAYERQQAMQANTQNELSAIGQTPQGPPLPGQQPRGPISMQDVIPGVLAGGDISSASALAGMVPTAAESPDLKFIEVPVEGKPGAYQKIAVSPKTAETVRVLGTGVKGPLATASASAGSGGGLTPFEEKRDKDYATKYLEWQTTGAAAAGKNMQQLDFAIDQLSKSDSLTGPVIGNVPDFILAGVAPDSMAVRDAVQEVAQQSLRPILGAQFGEKEGDRLIARAFNPRLSEKENIRRIKYTMDMAKKITKANEAMATWVEEHKTLSGYSGPESPSLGDVYSGLDDFTGGSDVDALLEKYK